MIDFDCYMLFRTGSKAVHLFISVQYIIPHRPPRAPHVIEREALRLRDVLSCIASMPCAALHLGPPWLLKLRFLISSGLFRLMEFAPQFILVRASLPSDPPPQALCRFVFTCLWETKRSPPISQVVSLSRHLKTVHSFPSCRARLPRATDSFSRLLKQCSSLAPCCPAPSFRLR